MVRFLIQRPIAVLMAFTACFIIGLVTYFTIPVSLLPGNHRTGFRPKHIRPRTGKHLGETHPPAAYASGWPERHRE